MRSNKLDMFKLGISKPSRLIDDSASSSWRTRLSGLCSRIILEDEELIEAMSKKVLKVRWLKTDKKGRVKLIVKGGWEANNNKIWGGDYVLFVWKEARWTVLETPLPNIIK